MTRAGTATPTAPLTFPTPTTERAAYPRGVDIPEVDVHQLDTAIGSGASVFDVREHDEYAAARIPGAVPVPMGSVPDNLREFVIDGPAYIVCATGARSARVVQFLRANGIDAINVSGGTTAWIDSGRGFERGPAIDRGQGFESGDGPV